jgi:hypothetical protein
MSGYYEWHYDEPENKSGQPYCFTAADGAPILTAAGIYSRWTNPEDGNTLHTFAMMIRTIFSSKAFQFRLDLVLDVLVNLGLSGRTERPVHDQGRPGVSFGPSQKAQRFLYLVEIAVKQAHSQFQSLKRVDADGPLLEWCPRALDLYPTQPFRGSFNSLGCIDSRDH